MLISGFACCSTHAVKILSAILDADHSRRAASASIACLVVLLTLIVMTSVFFSFNAITLLLYTL